MVDGEAGLPFVEVGNNSMVELAQDVATTWCPRVTRGHTQASAVTVKQQTRQWVAKDTTLVEKQGGENWGVSPKVPLYIYMWGSLCNRADSMGKIGKAHGKAE